MSQPHVAAWALSAQIAKALEQVRRANPGLTCKITANLFDTESVMAHHISVEFRPPQKQRS